MNKIPEYIAVAFGAFCVQLIMFTDSWGHIFSARTWHFATTTALARFSLLVFALAIAMRIIIGTRKDRPGEINPRHWYFDKETHEYYRIVSRRGTHFTYNAISYGDRLRRWFNRAEAAERRGLISAIVGLLILCVFKHNEFNMGATRTTAMLGGLIGEALIWIGIWLWATAERGKWEMVGPANVAPNPEADMNRQNAFGDAGLAGLSQIQKVLNSRSSSPLGPRFED